MDRITVGKRRIRALRHGVAGVPGRRLWVPCEEGDELRETVLRAGADLGLTRVGSHACATNGQESGWIPSPLPAIHSDPALKGDHERLPAGGYDATGTIGGSYVSDNIEDYEYQLPRPEILAGVP